MLTVLLLALAPQTVLVDRVLVVRPGQVIEVPLEACVEEGDALVGTMEFLPPSGCGVRVANLSDAEVLPSMWSTRVLMNVELRSSPLGWRDGGAVVGGLGWHDGVPTPPTLSAFDGTLDWQGPSELLQPYTMSLPGFEFNALNGVAEPYLVDQDSLYVACWQRWAFDYVSVPPWDGGSHSAYPIYAFEPGGMLVHLRIEKVNS